MRTLSIKNIIEFRKKSEQSKKNFVANLKSDKKPVSSDGGGDYWVSCLSAINKSYKLNDLDFLISKLDELKEKAEETEYPRIKTMYKRNIGILSNYKDYNFKNWRPSKLQFLKKNKEYSLLSIKELQIQVSPHSIFTFQKDGVEQIGAIWFIAKLGGLKKDELGMFTEALFKYLKNNFSKKYTINSKYCIAVDVVNCLDINYSQIEKNEIPTILTKTIDEINKLM